MSHKAGKKIFSLLFILFFCLSSNAQREATQEKLAIQYLEQKEFEKANVYLDLLYDGAPDRWYSDYYRSLLNTKSYDVAEKIVKKHIRGHRHDVYLYVHLGHVYSLKGEEKKAEDAYDKALKELVPMQPYLQQLSQVFLEYKMYERALAVYEKARKANGSYPFYYERAEIFKAKGDLTAMIGEYLDALEYRESDLPTVQSQLQNNLGYDDKDGGMKNPALKQELQKRIVKSPGKVVLVEFLIFIQKQQRDFEGAFVQSRALDKRLKEEGQRIYELAKLCVDNQQWATARRCYEYLLDKGPNSVYFDIATIEGLNVDYLALTQSSQPAAGELAALESKLIAAYNKYRNLTLSHQLLKNLVNLQAYYLLKSNEAISLLEEFISQPALDIHVRADFKLLLGDLYLVHGAIWDASLLYSQVEKDFKYETIGQDAKFRNARLSYYAGDFTWAKTQCDVLKGATSKLIANDALDLSLMITDAIGVDTNAAPLAMFASAELLVIQHRYNEAIARMDSINLVFPSHTLGDDINYKKADIFISLGRFAEAEAMYKSILEYYPLELYGDDAQFKLAALYENNLNDKEKAGRAYEDVLVKYPGSIYTVEARKRFRQLRGDTINN
jgi:tetratricopeptide (TPR) repeat protein